MDAFVLRVVASFAVAGAWIGAATMISERYGSKVGGLVGNLPSTVVVSFIFITLTQDLSFTVRAARAVPIGMTIDAFFLLVFVLGLRKGLPAAIGLSILGWFLMALAAHAVGVPRLSLGSLLFVASAVGVFLVMEKALGLRTRNARAVRHSSAQIVMRMMFAGTVVAVSVIVADSAGPYWAGLLSTFPAVMLSTLVILSLAQGPAFASGTAKVLALSSTNILAFALVATVAYPRVGLAAGTILGYGASVLWVIGLRPLVARLS